jgi:hypothetical protein
MQKKINREPNKSMLPVSPLGEGHPTPAQAREALGGNPSHKITRKEHESRMGRPTLKTPELCAEICRRISEGETMRRS